MKINRHTLIDALEIVRPGLANKELIEQTTSFAFLENMVVTFNDETCIQHPIDDLDFEGAVKAEEFFALLKKLKKDEVNIVENESELKLSSGTITAGVRMQKEILLPLEEVQEKLKWHKLPKSFHDAVDMCRGCVSGDQAQPVITCVNVTNAGIYEATDGFSAIQVNTSEELPVNDFLLPAAHIGTLLNLNPTHIALGNSWVHFKNENKTVFSIRILTDKFPNVNVLMQREASTMVPIPKDLLPTIERAGIFAKRDHKLDEALDVTLEKNRMYVEGKSDNGWYKEIVKCEYDDADSASFSIVPYLFTKLITQTGEFGLNENLIIFNSDNKKSEILWKYIARLRNNA